MSLVFSMMLKERYLRHSIMDKFPGVAIKRHMEDLTIRNMELILSKNFDELPEDVKPVAERLMCNAELAKAIGGELDWYYTTEQAKEYLADQELFSGSFAIFLNEKHSAQYLMDYCEKHNLIIKDGHIKKDQVHLLGDEKYRDVSDKYCPKVSFRKVTVPLRADNPEIFLKIILQLVAKGNHPTGWESIVH